jgi:hypothetical protein
MLLDKIRPRINRVGAAAVIAAGLFSSFFLISLPLYGQSSTTQLGTYHGRNSEVSSVTSYCNSVQSSTDQESPRVFAQMQGTQSTRSNWAEFHTETEWAAAGRPKPVVFVWTEGGTIRQLTVIASPPHNLIPKNAAFGNLWKHRSDRADRCLRST